MIRWPTTSICNYPHQTPSSQCICVRCHFLMYLHLCISNINRINSNVISIAYDTSKQLIIWICIALTKNIESLKLSRFSVCSAIWCIDPDGLSLFESYCNVQGSCVQNITWTIDVLIHMGHVYLRVIAMFSQLL